MLSTDRSETYRALIRERLPEKTYRHSVSVAEFLWSFARTLGPTEEQIAAAGLLHDYCKGLKPAELLEKAEIYGLDITDAQLAKPSLLHGPVGAEEVRRTLEIDDQDVYDAIYWHTTGKPGWCTLGLALYVADFAEPLRPLEESKQARDILASRGFEAALHYVAQAKTEHVRKLPNVEPATEAFIAWLASREPQSSPPE